MYNFDKEKKVLSELTKRIRISVNGFQQGDDTVFSGFLLFCNAAVYSDSPAVLSKNAIPIISMSLS